MSYLDPNYLDAYIYLGVFISLGCLCVGAAICLWPDADKDSW
jgi:hypothetical protein